MSTRSDIIVQCANGQWKRIYCHWDGYLEHNGKILQEHYNSQTLAESLVNLGDLSSLGKVIGEKHDFDWQQRLYDRHKGDARKRAQDPEYQRLSSMCNVYGRDRGEKETEPTVGDTLQAVWPPKDTWTEFTYIWSWSHGEPYGKWFVADPDEGTQTMVLLAAALAGQRDVTPKVKMFGGVVLGRHRPLRTKKQA